MQDEMTVNQSVENGGDERNELGRFAQGNPGGPGRPKGAPNKVNALLKEDILEAYERRGGVEWLLSLKEREFVRLLEKVLPKEIAANVKMKADFLDLSNLTDEELERLANALEVSEKVIAGVAPALPQDSGKGE